MTLLFSLQDARVLESWAFFGAIALCILLLVFGGSSGHRDD